MCGSCGAGSPRPAVRELDMQKIDPELQKILERLGKKIKAREEAGLNEEPPPLPHERASGSTARTTITQERPAQKGTKLGGGPKSKTPLTEGPFAPIPVVIDDLARAVGETGVSRGLARALALVTLDLVRFTDTRHGDVIITNHGISRRRGIGLPSVKATVKLLLQLHILRKEPPAPARLAELAQIAGGFDGNRRYLVWNPRAQWRIPKTLNEIQQVAERYHAYLGRARKEEQVT